MDVSPGGGLRPASRVSAKPARMVLPSRPRSAGFSGTVPDGVGDVA